MKEKTEKQPKPKKEKQERTPREATALMLGLVALGLAVVGVASLLWLSTLVAAILGGIAVLTGFASLMVGKKRNPAGNCCRSGRLFDRTICDHFYEDAVT